MIQTMTDPTRSPPDFWEYLDELVRSCEMVIDRPQLSVHPRYPDLIYPLDYGYLSGAQAMDGDGRPNRAWLD